MAKFVNRGMSGCTILEDGKVYLFDGISSVCTNEDAGFATEYLVGAIDVCIMSVVRLDSDYCEVFLDTPTEKKKYKVHLPMASFLQQVYANCGFIVVLSRVFSLNGKRYTQNLFVYDSSFNCSLIIESLGGSLCNV